MSKPENGGNNAAKKSPVTATDLAKNAYKQQFGVIVICADEAQQIEVYKAMREKYPNNKIKVVNT